MKPLKDNQNKENSLADQKVLDEKMLKAHAEDLGLDIPEDYFSKSKNEILAQVRAENGGKVIPLYGNKLFWAAAAIVLLIVTTVFQTNSVPALDEIPTIVSDTIEQLNTTELANKDAETQENDILISSLFVEESEIDEFVDNYMLKEALFEEKPNLINRLKEQND